MAMTITLDDDLSARLTAAAADAKNTPEELVATLLDDLLTQLWFEDGLPVLRVKPGAPPITAETINRVLNGYDNPPRSGRDRRFNRCLRRRGFTRDLVIISEI